VCGDGCGHDPYAHVHDDGVTSVSVVVEGEMDLEKVNTWLGLMLEVRGDGATQPSTLNPQPPTLSPQPPTLNSQPSTPNPQPSTLNPKPPTLNPQPSTLIPQPSSLIPQPSTLNLLKEVTRPRIVRGHVHLVY